MEHMGPAVGKSHAHGAAEAGSVEGVFTEYRESAGEVSLTLRRPTTRYLDQFLRLRAAPDMLSLGLFPDSKEITETFAAYETTVRHAGFATDDPDVEVVCVGDGGTPRTAATFALRTRWTCHSVDPALAHPERFAAIDRLHQHPRRIQAFEVSTPRRVVVVAVHAHVRIAKVVTRLHALGCEVGAAVVMPCCGYDRGPAPEGLTLAASHTDWGIWSPFRTVNVWLPAASQA